MVDVDPPLQCWPVIEHLFRDCCAFCATSFRFCAFVIQVCHVMVCCPPAYGRRFPKDLQLAFSKAADVYYFPPCDSCILMLLLQHPPLQHVQTYVCMVGSVKLSLHLQRCHMCYTNRIVWASCSGIVVFTKASAVVATGNLRHPSLLIGHVISFSFAQFSIDVGGPAHIRHSENQLHHTE